MRTNLTKVLKKHLMHDPAYFGNDKLHKKEHKNDFYTPSNLIVLIKTKRKNYTFGGPIYSASVNFTKKGISVDLINKQYNILSDKILSISLTYLRD
jgi:hypothetical protein